MFLFNSLHQGTCKVPGSLASRTRKVSGSLASGSVASKLRRNLARSVFALFVMLCLSTALLVTGCSTDDDPVDQLIGTWISKGTWGADGYIITSTHLSYGYGDDSISDISFAGTIKDVSTFSDTAGVIIIEYDADKKASYWEYDESYNPTTELPLKGNFIGIYYKNLKPGVSVSMGGAYVDGGAEEKTLDAAKKAFTAENEEKYIYLYGDYTYSK